MCNVKTRAFFFFSGGLNKFIWLAVQNQGVGSLGFFRGLCLGLIDGPLLSVSSTGLSSVIYFVFNIAILVIKCY